MHKILVGKPGGKKPVGESRRICEDNIRMDIRGRGWLAMDWIDLAEDTDQWGALVSTVMNFWVP
jgi:hypothetical protein